MIKVFDSNYYYIDLDAIENYVTINTVETSNGEQHISVAKYEMIKILLEVLLSEEADDKDLSLGLSNMSLPFKLSFNTLLNKKIINKY